MEKTNELAKNTLIILIGTICTKMITFLLLPLYTGILNTEEYGIYDLIVTLASLLFPIVSFQIEQATFRELIDCRNDDEKKKFIISSSLYCVIIQSIACSIIFLLISAFVKFDYKYYLLLSIITSIISSLFLQIARGVGDNKLFAKGSFISAFVTVIFNVIFLLIFNLRVSGLLIGQIFGQIICAIYLFISLHLSKYIKLDKISSKNIKKMLKYSIPLVPNALSWWVFSSSDKVIVSFFLGLSANGILAASTKISSMYTILYNVFDRSWMESISLHINDSDIEEYFNKMFNEILKFFISLSIVLISAMPFIFNLLINKKFDEGYYLIPILLISALFNVVQGLIAAVYAAKKNTKSIAKTSIAAAIANIIIHLGLIKFIGLYAAVFSTLASYVIICIYRYIDVKKNYLNIKLNRKTIGVSLLIIIVVNYIYYYNNLILNIISLIVCTLIFILYNKKSLVFVKNVLGNRKRKI